MATKSKNTKKQKKAQGPPPEFYPTEVTAKPKEVGNLFGGMISWLCRVFFVYVFVCGIALLIAMTIEPGFSSSVEEFFAMIFENAAISHELEMRINTGVAVLVIMFVLMFWFRKGRKRFESGLAFIQSKIWIEIKIVSIAVIAYASFLSQEILIIMLFLVLILYLLFLDIGYNGNIFKRNIVSSVINAVSIQKDDVPYAKKARRRLVSTILVILSVLAVVIVLLAIIVEVSYRYAISEGVYISIILAIIIFGLAGIIGTVMWYSLAQRKDFEDLSQLTAQIEEMYEGNLSAVNTIPPGSNFYDCAMQLNMIRTGIEKAVEEGIKADRTKVELITNVSHDIKTPLTSIISYVELLKQEENLPPHVMDYINTISSKAERLRSIVQDVFEVSKAATGNINLSMDDLDISKLLQQTIAEMDETMRGSNLQWRVDIPDVPMIVTADGQKLYRVFQNLIRNCAQYSLEGSRAYISLRENQGFSEVTIRNVARNELDPDAAENLTERFIRGDQTRTTEGSGLGLSIAKSFTEAIGGHFTIRTDGDIFLVTVAIPLVNHSFSGSPVPSPMIGHVNAQTITMDIPVSGEPITYATSNATSNATNNAQIQPPAAPPTPTPPNVNIATEKMEQNHSFAEKIPSKINNMIENISDALENIEVKYNINNESDKDNSNKEESDKNDDLKK